MQVVLSDHNCEGQAKALFDLLYRDNGDVVDADTNAARNVLARLYDNEIQQYTPYHQVKAILQERSAQSLPA